MSITSADDIQIIGVIGAGQMGNGIAHVAATAGYTVRLVDISEDALERARATIAKNLGRQVAKERISQADADAALARVTTATDLAHVGDAQLVVEAATESPALKHKIFAQLCEVVHPDAILATEERR